MNPRIRCTWATEYMCPEDAKVGVHLGTAPERSPFRTRCRSTGNLDGPQSRVPQIVDLPSLRAESMVLLRRSRLGHSDSRGRRSSLPSSGIDRGRYA